MGISANISHEWQMRGDGDEVAKVGVGKDEEEDEAAEVAEGRDDVGDELEEEDDGTGAAGGEGASDWKAVHFFGASKRTEPWPIISWRQCLVTTG